MSNALQQLGFHALVEVMNNHYDYIKQMLDSSGHEYLEGSNASRDHEHNDTMEYYIVVKDYKACEHFTFVFDVFKKFKEFRP